MAIDFPNDPSPGATFTANSKTWTFTGGKWALNVSVGGVTGATGATGATGPAGDWASAQAINTQTGTTYTVLNSDKGKIVTFNNAEAQTITINTATALSVGQKIDFLNLGTGVVTFVGSSVTLNATPGLKFRARYSAATLVCVGTNDYVLMGDLIS